MGGDAPVYETPADIATGILAPARTVPQAVIDLLKGNYYLQGM